MNLKGSWWVLFEWSDWHFLPGSLYLRLTGRTSKV